MSTETKQNIQLESLTIRKQESWRDENPGQWVAEATFQNNGNSMHIRLTPEVSEKLVEFLAPCIAQFGARAAQELADIATKTIAELRTPAIEAGATVTA